MNVGEKLCQRNWSDTNCDLFPEEFIGLPGQRANGICTMPSGSSHRQRLRSERVFARASCQTTQQIMESERTMHYSARPEIRKKV